MSGRVVMCVDEATFLNPGSVGLDGESLGSQKWLDVCFTGAEARDKIAGGCDLEEAWVVSSEDVEPINLAATLKADNPDLCVRLVEFNGCGSLFSRAHTAMIDEVIDRAGFVRRYVDAKGRLSTAVDETASLVTSTPTSMSGSPAAPTSATMLDSSVVSIPSSALDFPVEPAPSVASDTSAESASLAMSTTSMMQTASVGPLVRERSAPAHALVEQPVFPELPDDSPFFARPASAVAVARGHAFIMPVVSGSGGAGKSTVAVAGAHIARDMGFRTLLLDYDLQFGDIAVMAGVKDALAVDVAMANPDQLQREMSKGNDLMVLAAPERLETAETVVRGMPDLLDAVLGSFDVIVANTGAAWAEQHAVLLERSSAALFLIDQRASSVRACKHALDLCARCGIASGPFQFAVNRCSKNAPLTTVDVSSALQGASVFELRDGGRDVEDCLGGGAVADLLESGNEFCTSLKHVMDRLLPVEGRRDGAQAGRADDVRQAKRRGRHVGRKRRWGGS